MSARRETITNPRSERVKKVAGLSRRAARLKQDLTLIEGPQALREAIRFAPAALRDIYLEENFAADHPALWQEAEAACRFVHLVSEAVAGAMSGANQGALAVASASQWNREIDLESPAPALLLVLPATQDPGNLGTLLRLADAAGATGVALGAQCADFRSPKVIRSSAGSVFHLPVASFSDFGDYADHLRGQGWQLWGTSPAARTYLHEVRAEPAAAQGKIAIVLGNEAHGLSAAEQAACDGLFSIKMYGQAESLNVAAAGALCLFTLAELQHAG